MNIWIQVFVQIDISVLLGVEVLKYGNSMFNLF